MRKVPINLFEPQDGWPVPPLEALKGRVIGCINSFTTYELVFGTMRKMDLKRLEFLIDGFPVYLLLRIQNSQKRVQRNPGPDFTLSLIESLPKGCNIGIIGGLTASSQIVVNKLKEEGFDVRSYSEPIIEEDISLHTERVAKSWENFEPELLLICLGQPKQEAFGIEIAKVYPNAAILCVGAFIDFYSQNQARAPICLQKFGLEWAWRLFQEPKRLWKRYLLYSPLGLFFFLSRVKVGDIK